MSARVVASLSFSCLASFAAIADADAADPPRRVVRGPDFDGDTYADLAFGAYDSPAGLEDSGQVLLLWGGPFGLDIDEERGAVLWQDGPGVANSSSTDDRFGHALAWGDFDGDCTTDLVVGVPGEDIDVYPDAGAVHIFYGTDAGLSLDDDVVMHRDSPGMESMLAAGDGFGHTLAVGDFNGDYYDDLAISAYGTVDGYNDAGEVHIVYGSASGLDPDAGPGDVVIDAGTTGLHAPDTYDYFGSSVVAGDFDCDGDQDIAIRGDVAGENFGVHVLQGSPAGLQDRGGQLWTGSARGLERVDWVGGAGLASANFDSNYGSDPNGWYVAHGCMDLAIGMAYSGDSGAVVVLYGHRADSATPGLSLDLTKHWYFDLDTAGIPAAPEPYDVAFGHSLSVAQLDDHFITTFDDLVVGVRSGVVALRGSPDGLTAEDSVRWTRDTPGIPGAPVIGDNFGGAAGFGDFDGDAAGDLAITAPDDDPQVVPGFGNDVTVLDIVADAPPVISSVESWMAVEFPDQTPGTTDFLGISVTEGRPVWTWCGPDE